MADQQPPEDKVVNVKITFEIADNNVIPNGKSVDTYERKVITTRMMQSEVSDWFEMLRPASDLT